MDPYTHIHIRHNKVHTYISLRTHVRMGREKSKGKKKKKGTFASYSLRELLLLLVGESFVALRHQGSTRSLSPDGGGAHTIAMSLF